MLLNHLAKNLKGFDKKIYNYSQFQFINLSISSLHKF